MGRPQRTAPSPLVMTEGWYEVVNGDQLLQGDILKRCPVPSVDGLQGWDESTDSGELLDVDVTLLDLCVISQSCDLENDKITEIVLAQIVDWNTARDLE